MFEEGIKNMSVQKMCRDLRKHSSRDKAKVLQRFFKTGPGEYGEGDVFIGVKVPEVRKVARTNSEATLTEIKQLLFSKIHEERLLALLILVQRYQTSTPPERERVYEFYLKHLKRVNNWDLVDLSADKIVGAHLYEKKDRSVLKTWAKSDNLWVRRIAIISTFYFIKQGRFQETLAISRTLLEDPEDLIHKAVGWMLREVGKRDRTVEEKFLKTTYQKMPRTMLRYAIEQFPENRRKAYLKGTV